jgi:hypothetical protein
VSCPINNVTFVAIKMGRRQGGPSRTGGKSGAYLNRYMTDEQRRRRPIFIATLRAVGSWLFFRVASSLRINLDMLVARALKNSQLIRQLPGESHAIYGTGHSIRKAGTLLYTVPRIGLRNESDPIDQKTGNHRPGRNDRRLCPRSEPARKRRRRLWSAAFR